MNPKTQQRLEKLLETFDSGAVQHEELIKAIDAVMAIVKQSNEVIARRVGDGETVNASKFTELKSNLDRALKQLANHAKSIEDMDVRRSDFAQLQKNVKSEIQKLSEMVSKKPDAFDTSEIQEVLEAHNTSIENLTTLIVGENLRNALESLPKGEKLEIEAVEGLRDELDKLAKDWRKGGGGGLGSQIVLDIINQAVADGTIPSGDSLPAGGTTGQSLVKASNADGDVEWATPPGGGDMLASVYDPAGGEKQVAFEADLGDVAFSNDYDDLDNKPTIPTVPGTKNSIEVDSGDLQLVGDSATPGNNKVYGTDGSGNKGWKNDPSGSGAVDSVNGQTGTVVLDADDIDDTATAHKFVTSTDITNLGNLSGTNTGDVTVTDSDEIDFTLTGQDITAVLKAGSIDESKLDTSVNASLDLADSALQSGDNISELNNDAGFTTNTGTVTSVAVSGSDGIEVDSGSPVTGSGTIALGVNKTTLLSHINVEDGADVTDAGNVGAVNAAATSKTTPVDADSFPIVNSESSNVIGRVTFTNLKAFLKTYFDSVTTTFTNKIFSHTVEPSADDTFTGEQVIGFNATATIAQWEAVYLSTTGWALTDADATATAGGVMVGLASTSGTNGNPLTVVTKGVVRNDGWSWTTVGAPLYLSTTAGALTQTAPTGTDDVVRIVGYVLSDDCIYFNPSNDFITIV
jgi:hypothetical protein